jgi:carboxyl-terminal processing protease
MAKRVIYVFLKVSTFIITLAIAFISGFLVCMKYFEQPLGFPLLTQAYSYLNEYYFGDLPDDLTLQRGMIHGMVAQVGDPYTRYVEPVQNELQTDDLSGQYGGIGAYLTLDENGVLHVIAFDTGPAAEAGILPDDCLIAVDDTEIIEDMNLDTIVSLVRGPVGTTVRLTFAAREMGGQPFQLDLTRSAIDLPSVVGYLYPDDERIGVMVIQWFSERTPMEVETTFEELTSEGIEGLVLDIRGNTGGIRDAALDVSKFFLKSGLVSVEREVGGNEEICEVKKPGEGSDIPLVVLVDSGSASASEILAAALQQNDRAPLLGTMTYGKGSVQSILPLSDGSSLHVTVARWFTPDGSSIDGVGLSPDVVIEGTDENVDNILVKGVEILLEKIESSS